MALTDPYGDLETFKARANITKSTDDAVLLQVLSEASRQIDRWTGRCFNQSDAGAVRYFNAAGPGSLYVDDLVSVSAIATDWGDRTYPYSWLTTDYDLEPYEAPAFDRPYTKIAIAPNGRYGFPDIARGVRVTGVFGWPEVPADIVGATYLQANRLWKRKDAAFGILGSSDLKQMRTISDQDPDVMALIQPYKKVVGF